MVKTVDEMFDRNRQLEILRTLASVYPNSFYPQDDNNAFFENEYILAELSYLSEHGLVEVEIDHYISRDVFLKHAPRITARGIDLLKNDGGLTAILNVVTVKLHKDVIDLLSLKIEMSDEISPKEKKTYIDQLRLLPADAIKHLTMKLLDKGLENTPQLLQWLQTAYQSFPSA